MSKHPKRPISSFIASLLGIVLFFLVINVMTIVDEKEKKGESINYVTISVQSVHKLFTDASTGWDEAEKENK